MNRMIAKRLTDINRNTQTMEKTRTEIYRYKDSY